MADAKQNWDSPSEEIDLLDYLHVVIKRRRMIVRNVLYAALLMIVLSLILPSRYEATTTLMPPDEQDASGLRGLLANTPAGLFDVPGVPATSAEVFVEILKSRTVAEGVLKRTYRYGGESRTLLDIWEAESLGRAIETLQSNSRISANEQGIVHISVELSDPELAAQVANAYVAELDRVNQQKSFSRAKNSRLYIEEQLKRTEANLKEASRALAEFQAEYKAVNLEEQTKVAIAKAGELKGAIIAKEVELEVALQTMKPDNPAILRLRKQLDELKSQYQHLQFGNAVAFEEQKDYFIPFSEVPEVGLRYAELMREVKVQETVWELLNRQYYSAKIQEARDTPTVQILDEAVPPEKRSSPKRRLLVIVGAFLAGVFSIFWAFILEYAERVREHEESYSKLRHIGEELRRDYREVQTALQKVIGSMKARVDRWRRRG